MKIYEEVTADIVRQLETGVKPWVKGWKSRSLIPFNACKGTHYRGINILIMLSQTMKMGYKTNGWLGFKEAQSLGATVRKGEKATRGIYVKFVEDEETGQRRVYSKLFFVFNIDQIDNLPDVYAAPPETFPPGSVQDLVERSGTRVTHGPSPCYLPALDTVQMPAFSDFTGDEGELHWASTMFHELSHATGHPSRLNRPMNREEYAREECIAELSAAFLCSRFSYEYSDAGSPAYLEHWLKVLKEDSKALFVIAAQASRAADWLIDRYQPKELAAE